MICPHCARTISDSQRDSTFADPDATWPQWAWPLVLVLLFLFLVASGQVLS